MRILTAALICGTFLNANAMNHDMEVVENLVKCGNFTSQLFHLLSQNMDYENRRKTEEGYMAKCSDFYAKAVKTFRVHNPRREQWTIKKLRESTYDFLHKNGLDDLYESLAIQEIEVLTIDQELPFPHFTYEEAMQNYDDQRIKCINYGDNSHVIRVHYDDLAGAINLFHDSKYDNIKIGTFETNYNISNCGCAYSDDKGYSTIYMMHALEGYDSDFIHETGHFNQTCKYNEFENLCRKFDSNHKFAGVLYVASEMFAWTFEFRHLLEKKNISKEYIFSLGLRLPILFGNLKAPYYFSNLALSLANQPEKKLVDIADQAIEAIKNGVIINDGEDIRTEFTCDSNASPDEYGIDYNGVVRFNAEKNKAAIRDLLTRMGYDPDAVFERIDALTK